MFALVWSESESTETILRPSLSWVGVGVSHEILGTALNQRWSH